MFVTCTFLPLRTSFMRSNSFVTEFYSYLWHFIHFIFHSRPSTFTLKIILRTQWTMYCYGHSRGNEFFTQDSISVTNGPGGMNGPRNDSSRERTVQGTNSLENEYSWYRTVYLMLLSWHLLLIHLKTDLIGSGVIKMLNMITLLNWPEMEADLSFIWNKI